MANQEHLDILNQGVEVWNQWRQEHTDVEPDLSEADLSDANLSGADLHAANLIFATHSGVNLSGTNLSRADLYGAALGDADLSGTNLHRAFLSDAELREANLSRADLSRAYLGDADLSEANLSLTNFSFANLSFADLSRADLSRADLSDAYLRGTDLRGTYLSRANLSRAYLGEADLRGATIGWTIFGALDLRAVKGLETLRHEGPSTIGTDTVVRSHGDIPETFLREAGLPTTFNACARSLVQENPIEFSTCFISSSSQDSDFATHLHADLQQANVCCWFAPGDLEGEEKFWHRLDESFCLYDKLLVLLSQHSVNSTRVEREVMDALEKELTYNKLVLFPIKLDEHIMQTTLPWATEIRTSHHIGDFTMWKDDDAYQQAFMRLLRDLQA
jgi:uncharacterized protein YjbI with pentapeptide repeats